jgi:hypothetical protein
MPHPALLKRLAGYRAHLIAAYKLGAGMSSASKGHERRAFVHDFLEATFPPPNRFGTGDCIDKAGNQSGELDVVVEYPFLPSLTLQGHSRLYLAEGVAAVIEVKSNIAGEWKEACDTGTKLKALQRNFVIGMSMGPVPPDIPYFVVGYNGWKNMDTVASHCNNSPADGVLVIDAGLYYANSAWLPQVQAIGDISLFRFISTLAEVMSGLKVASGNPVDYAS